MSNYLKDEEIEAIKVNQEIIKRMANNSKHIKTLYLSLITISLSIVGSKLSSYMAYLLVGLILLTVICWYLDSRYLQLERQFREHHKAIVNKETTPKDMWLLKASTYEIPFCHVMVSFSMLMYILALLAILVIIVFQYLACYN